MSGLKAIGMVFGLLWLVFILGFGFIMSSAGQQWAASGYDRSAANMADDARRDDPARYSAFDEEEREYQREREGVHIEQDSARPMVDPDPSHRD